MSHGVYPGSFDPPTRAHLAVAAAARRRLGLDRLDLVVSRHPLAKSRPEPVPALAHRLAVLRAEAARRPGLGVRLSRRQLVVDLAEGADAVVLGADKAAQIVDPAWYGSEAARDRALARLPTVALAPRHGAAVPRRSLGPDLVEVDPGDDEELGAALGAVSSTRARAGEGHLMAPLARLFDEITGAWTDPGRYRSWAADPVLPGALVPPLVEHLVDGADAPVAVGVSGDDLRDDSGRPALPTVVLVHGFANDRTSWLPVIPRLAAHCRLVLPDLRGHGRSARTPGRYRATDHVADLVAVLEALCPEPVVLVGHSLAGLVAPLVAAHRPDRVRHLVLVDPAAFFASLDPERRHGYDAGFARLEAAQRRWQDAATPPAVVADEIASWDSPHGGTLGGHLPRSQLVATASARLNHDISSYDEVRAGTALPDLDTLVPSPRVTVAATVVAADPALDTALPPGHDERLRRVLPGVRIERLPGTGHMVHQDRPDAVAALVRRVAGEL